jgi:hypothetical protein
MELMDQQQHRNVMCRNLTTTMFFEIQGFGGAKVHTTQV